MGRKLRRPRLDFVRKCCRCDASLQRCHVRGGSGVFGYGKSWSSASFRSVLNFIFRGQQRPGHNVSRLMTALISNPGVEPSIRGRRFMIGLLWFGSLATFAYWIIWFGVDRTWLATADTPAYYTFENAFPIADGWMAVTGALGAVALQRRQASALLWMLLAGSASLYLAGMERPVRPRERNLPGLVVRRRRRERRGRALHQRRLLRRRDRDHRLRLALPRLLRVSRVTPVARGLTIRLDAYRAPLSAALEDPRSG